MSYGYYEYKPVQRIKEDAEKALVKLKKKNPNISPVIIEGKKIAQTWWGISWNENLERYADYASRITRGRAYVKNGMVLDLQISSGVIHALVAGSRKTPYKVTIKIDKLSDKTWNDIMKLCANKIGSLSELLDGKFPKELADVFFKQNEGLFPSPKEIHIDCSCPDWAYMCKHVAATLYAVGARLDNDPLLFFTLRDIKFETFLKKSADEKVDNMLKNAGKKSKRIMDDADINGLFGI